MLGMNYAPATDPLEALSDPSRGVISCYAQCKDYHDVVKAGLKRVAGSLAQASGADVKVFVDTAPLMEKPLGEAAGLGWQGKHTNLVSREYGSWLFLGAILTAAELEPDAPEVDHCGTCSRCLDVCPTQGVPGALSARCAPLHRLPDDRAQGPHPRRVPRSRSATACSAATTASPCARGTSLRPPRARRSWRRWRARTPRRCASCWTLDDAAFRRRFAGTPVKRTGRDRVMRNALIAAGNSGDASLVPAVERLLDDASPLVRAMAVWALQRLAEPAAWGEARRRRAGQRAGCARARRMGGARRLRRFGPLSARRWLRRALRRWAGRPWAGPAG